ncbi:hypothetical protein Kisp02_31600 [Kineosporia sp. NBRC 101731]|nr:hypothetical protein Kisp02_31600 [Kineosporia sp. NBRC 101731]
MAPGKGMLRPTVTQHNGFSWPARFKDFKFHTIDGDEGGLGKIGWIEHAMSSVSLRDDQATTVPVGSVVPALTGPGSIRWSQGGLVGEAMSPSWRRKPVIS